MQQTTVHQIDIGINTTTAIDNGEDHKCITQDTINIGYKMHKAVINNNQNFQQNWQTTENTMSIQQTLSRILGSIEKMDARVNYMEMRQTNNWNY